jgi:D-arginine dehydrogenase
MYRRDRCFFQCARAIAMSRYDVAIIGAGIAGASLAAELAGDLSILLLEAEDQPGYHATGRSAAFWSETYGGPHVQPLTTASLGFLSAPPVEFAAAGFLQPRGALHIGTSAEETEALVMERDFAKSGVRLDRIDTAAIAAILPGRRAGWDVALWEPDCCDIDVAGLHQAYLRKARQAGAILANRATVTGFSQMAGRWTIKTRDSVFEAEMVVNAAGAWADDVAAMASLPRIGIRPYRRTMVQLQVAPGAPAELPLVVALDGSLYFKPEAGGRIWLSPHDEIPSEPCDAAPDEIDVAKAIARFEEVVDWKVERIEHKWAGLRSFAPDRLPVIGFAPTNPCFFWLAGQGGFGIQTAPAVASIAAALLRGEAPKIPGVDHCRYTPARFD